MASDILQAIHSTLNDAMRAKDMHTVHALRLITAAVKQIEVDQRISLDDKQMIALLKRMAKQRNESITQFQMAARNDLIEQEKFELNLIEGFLPNIPLLSAAELQEWINKAITETKAEGLRDMGKVMAFLKSHCEGQVDMSQLSALVRDRLS